MTATTLAPVIGLFTGRPVPLVTRLPELLPATPWWTCPGFCDGTCYGGETTISGLRHPREHFKTMFLSTIRDLADLGEIPTEVNVVVREDATGWLADPSITIEFPGDTAEISPDDAERFANAILAAVAHARQELPKVTRSPSLPSLGGGRGSTPLEAS